LAIYCADEQEQLALDSAPSIFLPRSNLLQFGDVNTIDTLAFGWSVNDLGANQLWRSSRSSSPALFPRAAVVSSYAHAKVTSRG
jgi:hypothetical protein